MGMQVGSYRQSRDAVAWLRARRARFIDMPAELSPGIDYVAHVRKPEEHWLRLFYYIEQVGLDSRARPAGVRRPMQNPWREAFDPLPDTYVDQVFQGPPG
jgi:hypothetical protein